MDLTIYYSPKNIVCVTVVVMVTDPETKIAKPAAYLQKGMTFGVS